MCITLTISWLKPWTTSFPPSCVLCCQVKEEIWRRAEAVHNIMLSPTPHLPHCVYVWYHSVAKNYSIIPEKCWFLIVWNTTNNKCYLTRTAEHHNKQLLNASRSRFKRFRGWILNNVNKNKIQQLCLCWLVGCWLASFCCVANATVSFHGFGTLHRSTLATKCLTETW